MSTKDDWTKEELMVQFGTEDPVEIVNILVSESVGQTEYELGLFTNIIREGKTPSPKELILVFRELGDREFKINGLLLGHIGKLVAGDVGPGRPTKIFDESLDCFRNLFIRESYTKLRKEGISYDDSLEFLQKIFHLSPSSIKPLVKGLRKSL